MANTVNPKNNAMKQNIIMELWYQSTGLDLKNKINLARNSDIEGYTMGGKTSFTRVNKENKYALVYENPITLNSDQNLYVINYGNTHYFDFSNTQKGVEDFTNFKQLREDIQRKKNPNDKTVVFVTGNLFGVEWVISALNNANVNEKKEILFYGLEIRMKQFINDLTFMLKNGVDEIYIMNSREEHDISRKTNVDIFKETTDKFSKILMDYIKKTVQKENNLNDKKIEYVGGVKKVFNIQKKKSNGKKDEYSYSSIAVHSNLKSTANKASSIFSSAVNQHGGLASADVVLIASENYAGKIGPNIYMVSGQSMYKKSSRGNVPSPSPKYMNTLYLNINDSRPHDVDVIMGCNDFINERIYPLEQKINEEKRKIDMIGQVMKETVEERRKELLTQQYDYQTLIKEMEGRKKKNPSSACANNNSYATIKIIRESKKQQKDDDENSNVAEQ